jgi:hypothetical protein
MMIMKMMKTMALEKEPKVMKRCFLLSDLRLAAKAQEKRKEKRR